MLRPLAAGTLLLLASCENAPQQTLHYLFIEGRDITPLDKRTPLYRLALPEGWEVKPSMGSVADTMLPLTELTYANGGEAIRLTIHNFPYEESAQRVPPEAQVARWKKQFDTLEHAAVSRQAFAGFEGTHLWAEGIIEGEERIVSAWALQLAPEHERTLSRSRELAPPQTRSDVTIKAVGSKHIMEEQQTNIALLARSIELIAPIPLP